MPLLIAQKYAGPDVTVLEVMGHLTAGMDCYALETCVQTLRTQGVHNLVLDMAGVDQIDSAGLGVLVHCCGLMQDCGGHLRLAGPGDRVRKKLQVTRLELVLPVYADVADARRDL